MPVPMPVQSKVIFSIDQRLRVDAPMAEWHFELHADGTWSYIETMKQSIQKRASGKVSRGQVALIRAQLGAAKWRITHNRIACMAFAAQHTEYSVNGALVWNDQMCSGDTLDRQSTKRLERVMRIVRPLMR